MSNLAVQHFTDAGIDMLGQANAGALLVITKIVVGSGAAVTAEDIIHRTALVHKELDVVITRKTNLGNGKMVVSGVVTEWLLGAGAPFELREVGIMAKIGTGGTEKLYCAANVFNEPPDTVFPGGTSQHAFDIQIEIQRAENVSVTIDESTMIDMDNIPPDAAVGAGVYAGRDGKLFHLKRLVEGSMIDIVEEADRITIAYKRLTQNVDLYVPLNYPGITDPNILFPTVQAAHDYLTQFRIPADKTATIHVAAGKFSTSSASGAVTFSHPDSMRIVLSGWPRQDKAVAKVEFVNSTTKKVTFAAGVTNTGLVLGDVVYLPLSGFGWNGACIVVAPFTAGANFVNVNVPNRSTRTWNTNNLTAGQRLSWFPTVLQQTGVVGREPEPPSGTGVGAPKEILAPDRPSPDDPALRFSSDNLLAPAGLLLIENITFYKGFYVVDVGGSTQIKNCVIYGGNGTDPAMSNRGLNAAGTIVQTGGEFVVANCWFGVTGIGVIWLYEANHINGCDTGVSVAPSGAGIGALNPDMSSSICYVTHCGAGFKVWAASLGCGQIIFDTNNVGMEARRLGSIAVGSIASYCQNNGTDLLAQGMGYIEYSKLGSPYWPGDPARVPPGVINPANDIVGNQNSLIHVTA
jgi:hypothetical protein